ncbi:MAG TPA: hypothetical protein VJN18_00950 [Polyangiaceae bacterium]|nr:hypothetical protein [Polyangiaceae bacterium]
MFDEPFSSSELQRFVRTVASALGEQHHSFVTHGPREAYRQSGRPVMTSASARVKRARMAAKLRTLGAVAQAAAA